MSFAALKLFLALDHATARRLLWVRRDARPLPRPERRTVRIPVLSLESTVYGARS